MKKPIPRKYRIVTITKGDGTVLYKAQCRESLRYYFENKPVGFFIALIIVTIITGGLFMYLVVRNELWGTMNVLPDDPEKFKNYSDEYKPLYGEETPSIAAAKLAIDQDIKGFEKEMKQYEEFLKTQKKEKIVSRTYTKYP